MAVVCSTCGHASHDSGCSFRGVNWRCGCSQGDAKERFANRLRANMDPTVVMAEHRLREVVNGSPGSIVQVTHSDLRTLLQEYARLVASQLGGAA